MGGLACIFLWTNVQCCMACFLAYWWVVGNKGIYYVGIIFPYSLLSVGKLECVVQMFCSFGDEVCIK